MLLRFLVGRFYTPSAIQGALRGKIVLDMMSRRRAHQSDAGDSLDVTFLGQYLLSNADMAKESSFMSTGVTM